MGGLPKVSPQTLNTRTRPAGSKQRSHLEMASGLRLDDWGYIWLHRGYVGIYGVYGLGSRVEQENLVLGRSWF